MLIAAGPEGLIFYIHQWDPVVVGRCREVIQKSSMLLKLENATFFVGKNKLIHGECWKYCMNES